MRFTSLPSKSQSSPIAQFHHQNLPRSRWDNNFAVPMCGPWWRCHGSSYFLDLKWFVKSYVLGVKWFFHGSVKSNRGSIKSIDVILHRSFGVRHWGVPTAATLVWPPGGNNRLLVGSGRCCWYILFPFFPKCVFSFNAKLGWESVEMLYVGKPLLLHLLTCMGSLSFKCPL